MQKVELTINPIKRHHNMLKFNNEQTISTTTTTTKFAMTSTLEHLELRTLLARLRKSIELWFHTNRDVVERNEWLTRAQATTTTLAASSYAQIQANIVSILMHGLRPVLTLPSVRQEVIAVASNATISSLADGAATVDALLKLVEDFEWVRRYAQIRNSSLDEEQQHITTDTAETLNRNSAVAAYSKLTATRSIEQFLNAWTLRNLHTNCLCDCLQTLVADKELLETHYSAQSLLRNETYATALFICLSALELRQCSLLSQIEPTLYNTFVAATMGTTTPLKRSNSHPNLYISPAKQPLVERSTSQVDGKTVNLNATIEVAEKPLQPVVVLPTVFQTFRKIKSLPVIANALNDTNASSASKRARCKTISTPSTKTMPKPIPKHAKLNSDFPSSCSFYCGEDPQPSTSSGSKASKYTMASSFNSNSSCSHSTQSSEASRSTTRHIQLIKCDDIKIWTDQSQQQSSQEPPSHQSTPKHVTQSLNIPNKPKSISPINSFLASLFSTPPAHTNWSCHRSRDFYNTANETAVFPFNGPAHDSDVVAHSSGVFDAFLPKYGKKLRTRKSQNLFEDGISTLDQKYYDGISSAASTASHNEFKGDDDAIATTTSTASNSANAATNRTPTNCQSLATFLQMAQYSRNNTDLEKENAHFRISEAIISAIEHIKWAKQEPDKLRAANEATATIDWLKSEQQTQHEGELSQDPESQLKDTAEHIPYAELGESCLDLLSAEVVGLCLISKFNDRHLPKVSELKWLVADEDTPQKMLPLPDTSSATASGGDDQLLLSTMRGTKYWAPPRPQIIFTDHPTPDRKEIIQRQNNRCAGCGMHVSPQYLSSFRYCTYLGRYHCTGCHRNQITPTPAKILQMWDFKCYPVSVFAYRLLEQMYTYPLFYVPDLNAALYTRSKLLLTARTKRIQLGFVKDFIRTCRFATVEQQYFENIPDYICADPDTWSMSDFIDTKSKSMQRYIDEFIYKCEKHIFNCVLCTARGFICEHCGKEEIIYPWQNKIVRCDRCGVCFHQNCWKSMMQNCCRCQRIKNRQHDISEIMLSTY